MRPRRLLLVCLLVPSLAQATIYYVSPSGSDSTPCSAAQSPSTRKATLNGGAACLSPGDTLLVGDGRYDECLLDVLPAGLSASQPTTVQAEHPRQAIMTGTSARNCAGAYIMTGTRGDASGPGNPKSYYTIDGITFDMTTEFPVQAMKFFGGTEADGVPQDGPHDIQILNTEITGGRNSGNVSDFSIGIGFGFPDHHWTIRGNYIHDIGMVNADPSQAAWSYGMYLSGSDSLIEGNEIARVSGYAIHAYSNHGKFNTNIIRNNYIHDTGGPVLLACGGRDNVITNNIVARTGLGPARQQGGIVLGTTCGGQPALNNQVTQNTVVLTRGTTEGCIALSLPGLVAASGNTVQNNLCSENSSDTINNDNGANSGNQVSGNFCQGAGCSHYGAVTFRKPIPDSDLTAAGITVEDFQVLGLTGIGAQPFSLGPQGTGTPAAPALPVPTGLRPHASIDVWEWPRDTTPPADKFYLMVVGPQTLDTLWVAPSVKGACGTGADVTDDTFCAQLPDCPTQGTYEIMVKAVRGTQESAWSDPLLCRYDRQHPCECLTVTATPTSAQTPPGTPTDPAHTPVGTPTPAPVATVVPPSAQTPTFAPPPASTPPAAPTIPPATQVTIPLMQAVPQLAPA